MAFSGRDSQQDLGILASDSGLSLSTLDGAEEAEHEAVSESSFAPDESAFAPPDQEQEALQLAVDVRAQAAEDDADPVPQAPDEAADGGEELLTLADEHPAPPAAPARPAAAPAPAALRQAPPARDATSPADNPLVRARDALARSARARFAAGVLLALLLGFLPAHLFAAVREGDAYAEVRKEVHAEYAGVRDVAGWEALDEYLVGQRQLMDSRRTNIAVTSILIWGVVGGGLGFAWFRLIDWDRWA